MNSLVSNLKHKGERSFLTLFYLAGLVQTCLQLLKTKFISKYDRTTEQSLKTKLGQKKVVSTIRCVKVG